jgi:hypothetical protein
MKQNEFRRHHRVNSANLLAYSCRNRKDEILEQAMGRTLNISESGILLETHKPMDTRNIICLSIGFKQHILDINGTIKWCRPNSHGMFQSGIEFFGMDEKALRILKKYIEKIRQRGD